LRLPFLAAAAVLPGVLLDRLDTLLDGLAVSPRKSSLACASCFHSHTLTWSLNLLVPAVLAWSNVYRPGRGAHGPHELVVCVGAHTIGRRMVWEPPGKCKTSYYQSLGAIDGFHVITLHVLPNSCHGSVSFAS